MLIYSVFNMFTRELIEYCFPDSRLVNMVVKIEAPCGGLIWVWNKNSCSITACTVHLQIQGLRLQIDGLPSVLAVRSSSCNTLSAGAPGHEIAPAW